jgi:hypothetical protein
MVVNSVELLFERADSPELLVNFHLQTKDKLSVSSSPASYYGWRGGYHWAASPYRDTEEAQCHT